MIYTQKLVILRGNSGSGKSSIAKKLREESSRKIALIEQDYLRRTVLKEKEKTDGDNIDLIYQTVIFSLEHKYDVILEGILNFKRYGKMLQALIHQCPDHYVYWFDITFEETLKRHVTKGNAHEFGEMEMRKWYNQDDRTRFLNEKIIPESSSFNETVKYIQKESHL